MQGFRIHLDGLDPVFAHPVEPGLDTEAGAGRILGTGAGREGQGRDRGRRRRDRENRRPRLTRFKELACRCGTPARGRAGTASPRHRMAWFATAFKNNRACNPIREPPGALARISPARNGRPPASDRLALTFGKENGSAGPEMGRPLRQAAVFLPPDEQLSRAQPSLLWARGARRETFAPGAKWLAGACAAPATGALRWSRDLHGSTARASSLECSGNLTRGLATIASLMCSLPPGVQNGVGAPTPPTRRSLGFNRLNTTPGRPKLMRQERGGGATGTRSFAANTAHRAACRCSRGMHPDGPRIASSNHQRGTGRMPTTLSQPTW